MTRNRIERLERDLTARRRRRGPHGGASDRPAPDTQRSSRALNADDGRSINLLCDRPAHGTSSAASYVSPFEVLEAVDVDAGPSIDTERPVPPRTDQVDGDLGSDDTRRQPRPGDHERR